MSTEAIAFYRLSLKFKADNPNVYCNLIHSLMMICDWRNVRAEMPKVVETVLRQLTKGEFPSIHPHHTFLYPIPNTARKSIAAAHARLAQTNAATFGRGPYNFDHLRQELGSRIRVGYVSSDFMDHPTAHLMQSVPEFHNRARVEVFCYALSADDRSTCVMSASPTLARQLRSLLWLLRAHTRAGTAPKSRRERSTLWTCQGSRRLRGPTGSTPIGSTCCLISTGTPVAPRPKSLRSNRHQCRQCGSGWYCPVA